MLTQVTGYTIKMFKELLKLKKINELNIGHGIVAEALFEGWEIFAMKMKRIIMFHSVK